MQKTVICVMNEYGMLDFMSATVVATDNSLEMTVGNKTIDIPLESIVKELERMKECTDG